MDSASLLTIPGLLLVLLGELAVRVSPSWLPWLTPLGFLYGVGWLSLAVGVIWRVLGFRWRRAAIPAFVLVFTTPSFMNVFSFGLGGAAHDEHAESWELFSYNVRRLDEYSWLEGDVTRVALASWFEQRAEEVWCLQEFPQNGVSVLENAGMTWNSGHRNVLAWPKGAGPAVITSFPVKDWSAWMFPKASGQGRVLQADLETPSGIVRVFNVHLQSLFFTQADYAAVQEGPTREDGMRLLGMVTRASQARASQAYELFQRMEESPYPVIVAGDFNDSPMSFAVRRLRSGRVRDTFEAASFGLGGTHIGPIPGLRIDGILADTSLQVIRQTTHQVELSDHRPVSAAFSVTH